MVRKCCQKYSHAQREETWKKPAFFSGFISRYLSEKRSREAKKSFVDWSSKSILKSEVMNPLVYDELTSIAHTEFRFVKESFS